jgi:chromosome partitioning protein
MRRIALVCQKGGVGKSTCATALAVGMARRGHRVLVVDVDQQANASWTLLGGTEVEAPSLAAVLMRQASAEEAIRSTRVEGLDLLPANEELGGVNVLLAQELGRDTRLRSTLAPLEGRYDVVLLDTGPQFTTLLANVLVYAHEVIVPVDAGVYAALGLVSLMGTLEEVREAYGTDAHLAGLVMGKVQRNGVARDVEAELRSRFGDRVFKATIPLSVKVEEAHSRGLTVLEHAPKSPAAVAFESLVEEILGHGDRAEERGGSEAERRPRTGGHAA